MSQDKVATVKTEIDAPASKIWGALTDPSAIKEYMFGADVTTDWAEGSSIVWKGEWEGKAYEDKGKVLKVVPEKTLQYTHYSAMTGEPDLPENYRTVTCEISEEGGTSTLKISQDGSKTDEAKKHSEEMWTSVAGDIKRIVES